MPTPHPQRMIGYWNTLPLPEDISRIRGTWDAHGPEDITIYDHDSAVAFIEQYYGARERDAFLACAIPAMQSDVLRVLEILQMGGFWLDMGIELLAPPTMFLDHGDDLVLYRRWHGRIASGMFASPAGHPLLAEVTERIVDNVTRRLDDNIWSITGPGVWNIVTDTGNKPGLSVHTHADLAGNICFFNQDLSHKKDGKHWSTQQKNMNIYTD